MLTQMRQVARRGRSAWWAARQPLYVQPGHFYSPIPAATDQQRALTPVFEVPGVDLREHEQEALAGKLAPMWADTPHNRYTPNNGAYGIADAAVYHSMLRHLKPARVIEVGSGYSSALALDTADEWLPDLEMTFIEPFPQLLNSLMQPADRKHRVIPQPVQDVPISVFEQLQAGDVLFIDSTHVSKAGSDVNRLFLDILPRLHPGVHVHVHDVFWPFEYPEQWIRENRGWTENYLLRAFLAFNSVFEIEFFAAWFWHTNPQMVADFLPAGVDQLPGNIWLHKTS
jgi:hypothetical protein